MSAETAALNAFAILMLIAVVCVVAALVIGEYYVPQEWKIPIPEDSETSNFVVLMTAMLSMLITVDLNTRRQR